MNLDNLRAYLVSVSFFKILIIKILYYFYLLFYDFIKEIIKNKNKVTFL